MMKIDAQYCDIKFIIPRKDARRQRQAECSGCWWYGVVTGNSARNILQPLVLLLPTLFANKDHVIFLQRMECYVEMQCHSKLT